jgi:ubiquinone/menaquinone biosynthesis C-methylase UbiE
MTNTRVCPVSGADWFNSWMRKLIQNPKKILKDYVKNGMIVMDYGCGPGFFSKEMANMVGDAGKVVSVDIQNGMLEKFKKIIKFNGIESRVILHKCEHDKIGFGKKVDFILAFYMIHEVVEKEKIFREMKSILKKNGKILIVEPKFHVGKKDFKSSLNIAKSVGFSISNGPKVFGSMSKILEINKDL